MIKYMTYFLSISSEIDYWNKKLNDLAYKFDNPFAGMLVFAVISVIAFIAIRSFTSK